MIVSVIIIVFRPWDVVIVWVSLIVRSLAHLQARIFIILVLGAKYAQLLLG